MEEQEDEAVQLRSVALQNAKSILSARERAERELTSAKAALEARTEELASSLAMLQATLEAAADAIVVTSAQRRITNWNRKYVEMWRVPPEVMETRDHMKVAEVSSKYFHDPWHYQWRVNEIYTTAPAESYDLLRLIDGRVIERVSTIQYIGERNVGRVWSFRDMTERTRAEEEVRQQREWFRVTLRSIGDAVITTDIQGRVTFLNPIAETLTGWSSEEAAGRPLKSIFNIINEETREPAAFHPVDRVLREGIMVGLSNHTALISRNGTETSIADSAAPIRDSSGRLIGAVMVFHDVTENRRSEKALKQSHTLLQEAKTTLSRHAEALEKEVAQRTAHLKESIQSLESVCYTLAHDLRAPLRAVQGFAQIIVEDYAPELDAEGQVLASRIMAAATRMDALIRDLLEYAKLSHVELPCCRIDLNAAMQRVTESLNQEIVSKRATISIEPLPAIWGNPTIVYQIFSNVLSNALKFVNDDTVPCVHIWSEARDGGQRILVRDNGIGIAAEHRTRIFEMFERLHENDRDYPGTGVGLAIVKKGIERIGGKVSLENATPGGTCFQLDFQKPRDP